MKIHDLDRMFSRLIRARAGWTCAYCGNNFDWDHSKLGCSHFHSRRLHSVRFDPENAEAMCFQCHYYLDTHPPVYEEWKRQQLGEERFEALRLRSQQTAKVDLVAIRETVAALASVWDRE